MKNSGVSSHTEVINSSPKSHYLWREGLTWGDRPKNPNYLWVWEWFQSENGIFDIFWCLEMLLEQCCDSMYSHVWWFTDEMAEKDDKFKKNRSACRSPTGGLSRQTQLQKLERNFPIISLERQTILLNLYNWKRLLSFQFCIAVVLNDFSFEGISICRVSCVFIANFGVEYVECIITLYIVIKHWTGPDDDSC